jgi:uncharacterized protein (DUF1778 family)
MTAAARNQKLDLRLTTAAKETLREAAAAAQRSISDFVLESALARADEALADRRRFGLDAKRWSAFLKALDKPTRRMPRAKKLLTKPSVFERR